jgi:tubulysin polyketide synthase-like protein
MSPVDLLKAAADRGLTLRINGEKLRVLPAEHLSADFAEVLKAHKPALLALLKLRFVMVDSQILGETIFFAEDDATRGALVQVGASECSICTRAELQTLCAQNRIAPLTASELRKLQEIKRACSGRISS